MEVRSTYSSLDVPRRYDDAPGGRIGTAATPDTETNLRIVGNRSVISHQHRDEIDDMRKTPEVNGKIRALFSSVQLTARQAEVLLARIRDGYYLRPEVLHAVAAVICPVLEQEP